MAEIIEDALILKKENFARLVVLVIFLGALNNAGLAQWNFSFAFDQEYNNNPFHLPENESSWISSLDVGIEREVGKILLSYYGSYANLANLSDRNFYWHQFAVGSGSDTTNWGVYAEQRINRQEFKLYDYQDVDAYFNHKFFIQNIINHWNAKVQFNQYQELPELNNWKLFTNFRFQKTLRTKTTLITHLGIDFKNYLKTNQVIEILPDSSLDELNFSIAGTSADQTTELIGMGNGKGGGKGKGYFHGNGGGGYLSTVSYANMENSSVAQFWLSLRIAQSVTPTFGLAAQFYRRFLLTGNDRYIAGLSDSYSRESEIFNDPMGYESDSYGLDMTKLLPFDITLKAAAYYVAKNYSSQGIFSDAENYDETNLRNDKYKMLNINARKNFDLTGNLILSAIVSYHLSENKSNSYWYNYSNQYASIGFEFQF